MNGNYIDAIHEAYNTQRRIIDLLSAHNEPSLAAEHAAIASKMLLLASASYFEHQIGSLIGEFTARVSRLDKRLISLIKSRVIERQYHSYFQWNANNINSFLAMFGPDFKAECGAEIEASDDVAAAVKAFIEIGRIRNGIVHSNLLAAALDITVDEVIIKHDAAMGVITLLRRKLAEDMELAVEAP